jgi:Co/Zn/Cd efflux system component
MTLAANAWRLRQAARRALMDDDPERAQTLASQAESICHTPVGKRLQDFSAWWATL